MTPEPAPIRMSAEEVSAFLDRVFPEMHHDGRLYHVEAVGPLSARVRLDHHPCGPAARCPARR